MKRKNPEVVFFDGEYAIRFTRNNYKVLIWVQDLFSKKMKSEVVNRPIVLFANKTEAEQEVKDIVLPYLLNNKDIDSKEIVGW